MKFFHLSDLHLGLKLMNYDMSQDQKYVLEQIVAMAAKHKPDAIVIAGDVYDKAIPSAEAMALFDWFLNALKKANPTGRVLIVSGNHDSSLRLNTYRSLLEESGIHMVGTGPQSPKETIEKVELEDAWGKVCFYLLPYMKPSLVSQVIGKKDNERNDTYDQSLRRLLAREELDQKARNVLVSHQFYIPAKGRAEDVERMDTEVISVGNTDAVQTDVLEPFDYAALGHIHKRQTLKDERFVYCGTPMACSVSEAGQQKGVVLVEMKEKGAPLEMQVLPLKPLHEIKILTGSLQELLKQGCDDYVSLRLSDQEDLDVLDAQERLHAAFGRILDIRRESARTVRYAPLDQKAIEKDPLALCCSFIEGIKEEEIEFLKEAFRLEEGECL